MIFLKVFLIILGISLISIVAVAIGAIFFDQNRDKDLEKLGW
jgi:Na+/phosphate symporter